MSADFGQIIPENRPGPFALLIQIRWIHGLAVFLQGVHLFDIADVEQERTGAEKRELEIQEQPFAEDGIHQHPGGILVICEDIGIRFEILDDALFDEAPLAGVGNHGHVADRIAGQDARQQVLSHAVLPLHPFDGDAELVLHRFRGGLDYLHLFRRNRDIPGHRIDIGRIPCGDVVGAEHDLLGGRAGTGARARSGPFRRFFRRFAGAQPAQHENGRKERHSANTSLAHRFTSRNSVWCQLVRYVRIGIPP